MHELVIEETMFFQSRTDRGDSGATPAPPCASQNLGRPSINFRFDKTVALAAQLSQGLQEALLKIKTL
jgi:hypothetical protein